MPTFRRADAGACLLAPHGSRACPHTDGGQAHCPAHQGTLPPLARPPAGARRTLRPTAEVPTHG